MRKNFIPFIFLIQLYFPARGDGQDTISLRDVVKDTIYLDNPSFEDVPRRGKIPTTKILGWNDCGLTYFPGESPPDIHPVPGGAWGVEGKANDGDTYLGLVFRSNATWEMVSQNLKATLHPGKYYSMHVYLSLSPVYLSRTKLSPDVLQDFSHPAVLRIWGGVDECDRAQLLAVSYPVAHYDWKEYSFEFSPAVACQSITLEAFYYIPETKYSAEKFKAYNGHIMVDHLSPIIEMECK